MRWVQRHRRPRAAQAAPARRRESARHLCRGRQAKSIRTEVLQCCRSPEASGGRCKRGRAERAHACGRRRRGGCSAKQHEEAREHQHRWSVEPGDAACHPGSRRTASRRRRAPPLSRGNGPPLMALIEYAMPLNWIRTYSTVGTSVVHVSKQWRAAAESRRHEIGRCYPSPR